MPSHTRVLKFFAIATLALASGRPAGAQVTPPAQPAAAAPAPAPNDYGNDATWLCRPDREDACAIDHSTTVIAADGRATRETWSASPKAPIDCFYVYPTISTDPGVHSDMTPDAAERNVVAQQFARFASQCRPFAPLYRQVTLAGLRSSLTNVETALGRGLAYDDVLAAWRSYMAHDNRGRGFVLIGHSQGSFILTELLRQEIDAKPIQSQLVSAFLLGSTVTVARGQDAGGSFKTIPLCRKPGQIGCVVTYASFRSTVPPPATTLFGRTTDPMLTAACTNPVTLGEGPAPLRSYLSSTGRTVVGTTPPQPWVSSGTAVDTPWVSVPGLLSARCATNEFATYLEITVKGDPADPRVDDIVGDIGQPGRPLASWGLHLVDVNLAMGNLVDLVAQQAKAYGRRRK